MLFLTGILTNIVTSMNASDIARQIANAHTIFNIVNVIVLFPFANLLVKLADFIIPEPQAETMEEEDKLVSYLDKCMNLQRCLMLQTKL